MRHGGKATRRTTTYRGQTKQSRAHELCAAQQRRAHKRTLLRRGAPPRAMRSVRTTSAPTRATTTVTRLAKVLRKSS